MIDEFDSSVQDTAISTAITALPPHFLTRIREEKEFLATLRPALDELEERQQKVTACVESLRDVIATTENKIKRLENYEWC